MTSSGRLVQPSFTASMPSSSQVVASFVLLCNERRMSARGLETSSGGLAQQGLHTPWWHSLQPLAPCLAPWLLPRSTCAWAAVCKAGADSIAHLMPASLAGRCPGVEASRPWAARGPLCGLLLLPMLLSWVG